MLAAARKLGTRRALHVICILAVVAFASFVYLDQLSRLGSLDLGRVLLWICAAVAILSTALAAWLRRKELTTRAKLQAHANALELTSAHLAESIDRLRAADSRRSEFFSNVSHELRTPLTLVLSPIESLIDDPRLQPYPAVLSRLSMMRRNATRLLRMINGLLDLAKIDAGKMRLDSECVQLAPFLGDVLSVFAELAQRKGVTLQLLDAPDASLLLDVEKVETILHNLIANALKFTPQGGVVTLSAGIEDTRLWIGVRDTGTGIAAEHQERIFERFAQADATARRRFDGTGLGLALSRELAEVHGGTLEVDSKPGEGCRFLLSLPLQLAVAGSTAARPALIEKTPRADVALTWEGEVPFWEPEAIGDDAPHRASSGRVLVVEDSPDMRQLLHEILSRHYEVLLAADGTAGLAQATQHKPDLIVSDVIMPGMSGYELTRLLKSEPLTCEIPVILLTAKLGIDATLESFAHGADDKLSKPFHPDELLARVRARLDVKRLQDALREKSARLEQLARIDALTGLSNHRHLLESLQQQLEICRRHRRDVAFIMADIDNFKIVNDRFGHEVGDRALALVAHALRLCMRTQDLVGRYGGEEFGMILPDTDGDGAAILAERCRVAVATTPLWVEGTSVWLTLSLGTASWSGGNFDGSDLVSRADHALYLAKRGGRNRSVSAKVAVSIAPSAPAERLGLVGSSARC